MLKTFAEILALQSVFREGAVHWNDSNHSLQVNIIGLTDPVECEILEI